MAANKKIKIGPVALTTVMTTNIVNPPTTTGGVGVTTSPTYLILTRISVTNKSTVSVALSLWLGATAGNVAGTEVIASATPIAANSVFIWYGQLRIDSADFLVGGASAATALTFQADAEIGVSG